MYMDILLFVYILLNISYFAYILCVACLLLLHIGLLYFQSGWISMELVIGPDVGISYLTEKASTVGHRFSFKLICLKKYVKLLSSPRSMLSLNAWIV